ncbi:sensor histidine kinase [Chloroflexota bacterium]
MPMENNVNHKNMDVMWRFLKGFAKEEELQEEDVNIFEMLQLNFPDNYSSALEYYTDPTQWSPLEIYVQAYLKTKEVSKDPNAFRNCGRSAASYGSFGPSEFIAKTLGGPTKAINNLPSFFPEWNDTKLVELVRPAKFSRSDKKMKETLMYKFHSDIEPHDDYCSDPHILGLLEAIPQRWSLPILNRSLPKAEVQQPLVQYDPVKLFQGRFFDHLDLQPFFDENGLEFYMRDPNKNEIVSVGKKVILLPTNVNEKEYFLGDYEHITGPVGDKIVGTLIQKTIEVDGELVCQEGVIMEAPYFLINVSFEELFFHKAYWNIKSFFTGRKDLFHELEESNKVLRTQVDQKNIALKEVRGYKDHLEELVEERTAQLIETKVAEAKRAQEAKTAKELGGGLAHGIGNVSSPAALQINTILEYKDGKPATEVLIESGNELDGIIVEIGKQILALGTDYGVPKDVIYKQMLPLLQKVDVRSKEMSAASERIGKAIPPINNAIGRSLALAQQFFDYSKSGDVKRGSTEVNLISVIKNVETKYSDVFKKSKIEYVTNIYDSEPTLLGDYLLLETVLENLVLNAKDAIREKGKIEVTLARHNKTEHPYFQLIVEDNGEGISKENQAKIFDPFFTTKPSSGHGLGLNYLERIVEAYNGKISVKSEIGKGTTFYINLPIKL